MQGPRFTAAAVEGGTYLLAANGHELFATSLKLQSIHVENALAEHGAAADTSAATSDTNRLLNYIHSCCLRFPLDDCIGLAEATQHAQKGGTTVCRTVRLHMATGVLCMFIVCLWYLLRDSVKLPVTGSAFPFTKWSCTPSVLYMPAPEMPLIPCRVCSGDVLRSCRHLGRCSVEHSRPFYQFRSNECS